MNHKNKITMIIINDENKTIIILTIEKIIIIKTANI